jgi:hypothetical protein
MLSERKPRGNVWVLLMVVLFSAIFGGLLSTLLKHLIRGGILHDLFVQGVEIGLTPPWRLDLGVLEVTFGFSLDLSLVALICILIGLLIYRKAA